MPGFQDTLDDMLPPGEDIELGCSIPGEVDNLLSAINHHLMIPHYAVSGDSNIIANTRR